MDNANKKVDDSWKERAEREKHEQKNQGQPNQGQPNQEQSNGEMPPVNFKFFITTLGLQASIALGYIPNPVTNEKENDPRQAKLIIDTLGMLQEKTKGNLTKDEEEHLENILYELRMVYVSGNQEKK